MISDSILYGERRWYACFKCNEIILKKLYYSYREDDPNWHSVPPLKIEYDHECRILGKEEVNESR